MLLNLVGMDPAFRNTGYALATYDTETHLLAFRDLALVQTEKTKIKTTRRNTDDLRRCSEIYLDLQGRLRKWDANVVICEVPVGSQSARAALGVGAMLALISTIEEPVLNVTATQVKLAGAGHKHATKQEMIDWGVDLYPELPWLRYRGALLATNEHLVDAVAAIHAGIQLKEFGELVRSYNLMLGRRRNP